MSYEANRKYYDTPGVPELFGKDTRLMEAEAAILSRLRDEIKDKPLLDIGIGGGRTTPHLLTLSRNYIGIDYSENMINFTRRRAEEATLLVCDARDMALFKDGQFAAVFFFYNGIDSVDPSGRIMILKEVHRVLEKGGVFVFSSHNFDWWERCRLASFSRFSFSPNPITMIRDNIGPLRVYSSGLLDRLRSKLRRRDHAVIRVYEEFMVLPIYYITREAQIRQLSDAGFGRVETIGSDGRPVDGENRSRDYLVHYVARRE